jgi:hypothetical protein
VVSTVLVVKRSEEGKAHGIQRPVYFISEVLSPTKQRYPHYQKLAYSVFTIARKLWQYFAVHPIIVVNKAPLSNILNNPSATGRVSLWGIELSPLDIHFLEPIPENFSYSLGGYSHRERWARTRWYLSMNTEAKKAKENSESFITPIGRELFIDLSFNNSNISYTETVKQGCDIWFSSCVIATKLKCRD